MASSHKKPKGIPQPSGEPTEIIDRQRKTLMLAIKEADRDEGKRLQRLDNAPKESRTVLQTRFEVDRIADQERIKHLMFDYKILKEKIENGELPRVLSSRVYGGPEHDNGIPKVNRFAGCENENDTMFMKKTYERFDKLEVIARRRNLPKYNEAAENHKLKLLGVKRDILHKLVAVQTSEINNRGDGTIGNPHNVNFQSSSRHQRQQQYDGTRSSSYSQSDKTSPTSGESWATFATKNSSGMVVKRPPPKQPPIPVPKLKL